MIGWAILISVWAFAVGLFFGRHLTCANFPPHDWGKWATIEQGPVVIGASSSAIGNYLLQKRTCNICGKEQLEMNKSNLGTDL